MAKLTLSDVSNLQNENSATATINSNSAAVETAVENTLSRDGTAPNQMEANFDMNSYRILNLPKAVNADEPLRLQDLSDFYGTGGVSNIPSGGNQGDVLAKTASTNYVFDWVSTVSLLTAGDNIVLSGTSPATVGTTLTPTFTTVNGITLTASTGTFTLTDAKTLTVSNTLTFTGTDGSTVAFGAGGTVAYTGASLAQFATTSSAELIALISDETGTGNLLFSNSPTLVTPALGTPSAVVLTNGTGLPISTGVAGLATGVATFLATPSSANLRAVLTDEVGTGAAYFVGGDLGTPAAGVATNLTGTASGLTAGNVTTNANLTGDVTSVGNATTIANNAVTNAKAAQMAAYTLKGNATGSTANAADIDVTALTSKASPVSADIVLIQDSAASNAFKKTTVGALASAGSVSSIAGNTGAFTLGNGIDNSTNLIQLTAARRTLPTAQVFTSGSGTYTTPANCLWIEVEMVGGGGGGAGAGSAPGNGGTGGNTTFSTLTANGGAGAGGATGGGGGTASGGTVNKTGGGGGNGSGANTTNGGAGGASFFGSAGNSGVAGGGYGIAAGTNSGSGGGGGGVHLTPNGGGGGGSGGYVYAIINSPSASYSYAVGAAGTAGSAGGGSGGGGAVGGAGIIIVTEHYGS